MATANLTGFASSLLAALGHRPTQQSVRNLLGWFAAEGGWTHNDARFNPLNTTQPAAGAGNTGTQGNIKVYRSFGQGVQATAQTLRNGHYGGILAALDSNPSAFAHAVNVSPWGTKTDFSSLISGAKVGALPTVSTSGGGGSGAPAASAVPAATAAAGTAADTMQNKLGMLQALRSLHSGNPSDRIGALEQLVGLRSSLAQPASAGAATPSTAKGPTDNTIPSVGGVKYGTPFGTTFTLPNLPSAVQAVSATGSITNPKGQKVATATFDGKPVSEWWASMLSFARKHGWAGQVNSGYRSVAEQQQIWNRHPDPTWVARPGHSPHQYAMAVDISQGPQLEQIIRKYHLPIARYAPEGWHYEPLGFRTNGTQRTFG